MPADDPTGLFPTPRRPKGPAQHAVEHAIADWRKGGRAIDAACSAVLRAQGAAIDLAMAKADPWQVSNATRVFLELAAGYGLVAKSSGADPFVEAMNAAMAEDAGGLDP